MVVRVPCGVSNEVDTSAFDRQHRCISPEAVMPTQPDTSLARTHVDIHDSSARAALAQEFGVSEEQLRRAVRLVGSGISTLRSHFRH